MHATDIYAFALVCYEVSYTPLQLRNPVLCHILLQTGEIPSLPADDLSWHCGLSAEMEDLTQDCWTQDPMKQPSADKVVA